MSNKYLIHHGVKGMHWGIRRYQNHDGTLKHPKGRKGSTNSSNQSEPEKQKKKGLTDKQKRAIKIGAAVAGAALLTYGVYKVSKSGAFKSPDGKVIEVDFTNKSPLSNINFDYNKGDFIVGEAKTKIEKTLKAVKGTFINPDYINPMRAFGVTDNCGNCTIATILRESGIDCQARFQTNSAGKYIGMRFDDVTKCFGISDVSDKIHSTLNTGQGSFGSYAEANKAFKKLYKDGGQGCVAANLRGIGGKYFKHVWNWKMVDGNVVFYDNQAKRNAMTFFEIADVTKECRFCKLDPKDLVLEEIEKWVDVF